MHLVLGKLCFMAGARFLTDSELGAEMEATTRRIENGIAKLMNEHREKHDERRRKSSKAVTDIDTVG